MQCSCMTCTKKCNSPKLLKLAIYPHEPAHNYESAHCYSFADGAECRQYTSSYQDKLAIVATIWDIKSVHPQRSDNHNKIVLYYIM